MSILVSKGHSYDVGYVEDGQQVFVPGTIKRFQGASVTSTSSETDLATIAIPSNEIYDGVVINWKAWSRIINGSGSKRTLDLRIYVNDTLVYHDTTGAIATGAVSLSNYMDLYFAVDEETSEVYTNGLVMTGGRDAPTTGSAGGMATGLVVPTTPIQALSCRRRSDEDLVIRITAQPSNAEASSGIINTNNIVIINPR